MTAAKVKTAKPEPTRIGEPDWDRIGALIKEAAACVAKLSEVMLREKAS
jgi:hypothetical protein